MKRILILLFLAVSTGGFAQQMGDYHTKNYPEISFVWHEYNPRQRTKADFVLKDNEIVNVEVCTPQDSVDNLPKTILFLWEDMFSHDRQSDFIRQVLISFLNSRTNNSDKFNIAVFSRKKNGQKVLHLLSNNFVPDKQSLIDVINGYQPDKEVFSPFPRSTDLYEAIGEGLDYLQKEPGRIKAIVVLTAGLNMNTSGSVPTPDKARSVSLETKIPVYVVQYIRFGEGGIIPLATETYGESIATMDAGQAENSLAGWYKNMNARIFGIDYRITFRTDQERDGESHNMTLVVAGADKPLNPLVLTINFSDWVKEYTLLFTGLTVLFLALVAGIFFFIRKKMKEKQEEQAKKDLEQDERIRQAQEEYDRIAAENSCIQNENAAQKGEERRNHLVQQMHVRNLYPRLVGNVNGENINFTVTEIETTIGRAEDNDLVLSLGNVSGHHAKIVFNGEDFEIFDLNSTNYVIVNGYKITQTTLKNTDMIGLGDAILTIYI